MRVISTFGRCDICDRRSPLSRQNRWQLPLSVLGSIIATASCTALYGAKPQPSPEATERDGLRRASGFIPDERHGSAPTAALVTDQTTDHVQASDPYFQGEVLSAVPHCIFTNSFETIKLPEHFALLPLHCFTDHVCPPSSPLGRSTILHLKS